MKPKTKRALHTLTRHPDKLAQAVKSARADIAAVEGRSELTTQAKREAVEARRQELRDEVHAIEEECKAAADEVKGSVDPPPSVDPVEAMRSWGRIERLLDSGQDPTEVAAGLVQQKDRAGLTVLLQELPSYLQAAGGDRRTNDALVRAVRAQEVELRTPDEAEAHDALANTETALYRLQMNTNFVLKDGETTEMLVAADQNGPNPNHTIPITEED